MVVLPHHSTPRLGWPRALVVAALTALPLGWATAAAPGLAQQSGYGQTMGTSPQEQQIYNYDPSGRPGPASGGLNPANPLDLINKIRKGSAMDDATPPGDAVDQALKELEAQSRPQPGASGRPAGPSPQPLGTAAATP
ncbi:MAG: hypothetical protein ACK59A_16070 [Cyanobacteriota bacterium]|jgi:hypothetical protein